jgi:hypothetical protein
LLLRRRLLPLLLPPPVVVKSNETAYLADGTVQKATGADALRRVDRKQAPLARCLGVLGRLGLQPMLTRPGSCWHGQDSR